MIETLCHTVADAGAAETYSGPPQAKLICSPVTLKRAFANLIHNAVKYRGGARVVLDDTGQQIGIRLEDEGPGIPEADMQAVFEPFRRLETSRNRGTGAVGSASPSPGVPSNSMAARSS